jgi:tetratricopeptide (TPR) repeat protein
MRSKVTEFDSESFRHGAFFKVKTLGLIASGPVPFYCRRSDRLRNGKGHRASSKKQPAVQVVKPKIAPPEKPDATQKAYENFALASVALNQGRYQDAKAYLEDAIQNDPDSVYLNTKMAVLLKGLKEYPEALAYAQKSVGMDPKNTRTLALLGDLYALTGKDELAVNEYRNILKQDPQNKRIRLLLTTIWSGKTIRGGPQTAGHSD